MLSSTAGKRSTQRVLRALSQRPLTKRASLEKDVVLMNRWRQLPLHQSSSAWFSSSYHSRPGDEKEEKPVFAPFITPAKTGKTHPLMVSCFYTTAESNLNSSMASSLVYPQRRWMASTAAPTGTKADQATASLNVKDTDNVNDDDEEATGLRGRYQQGRENLKNMSETARESYQEFREHPRESMKSGAKSLSGKMRQYGPVFVTTYLGVYVATLAGLYAGVQSGLLDPAYLFSMLENAASTTGDATTVATEAKSTSELVVDWMQNHDFTKPYAHIVEERPYVANLAVAWIACKFTEPVRLPVSVALTPPISRSLGYTNAAMATDPEEDQTREETNKTDASSPSAS